MPGKSVSGFTPQISLALSVSMFSFSFTQSLFISNSFSG